MDQNFRRNQSAHNFSQKIFTEVLHHKTTWPHPVPPKYFDRFFMFWIGCKDENIWKYFQRNLSPPHHRTGWLFAAPGRNPASPIISSIRFNRTIQLAEKMCSLPNTSPWHTSTNMHFSKHRPGKLLFFSVSIHFYISPIDLTRCIVYFLQDVSYFHCRLRVFAT